MLFGKGTAEKPVVTITERITQYLTENKFGYTVLSDGTLRVPLRGDHVTWTVFIRYDDDRKVITIHSVLPLFAEDAQKLRIADLLNRLNYCCLLGKWWLDNEDGEVSHITSFLADETCFSIEQFSALLHINYRSVDKYFPAIASVNFGNLEPALVFNSIS